LTTSGLVCFPILSSVFFAWVAAAGGFARSTRCWPERTNEPAATSTSATVRSDGNVLTVGRRLHITTSSSR
jgi:hypothetical protein